MMEYFKGVIGDGLPEYRYQVTEEHDFRFGENSKFKKIRSCCLA